MGQHAPRNTGQCNAVRWLPPLLVLATILPLYLQFRSISLDDFDAYSFALALDHFDLALQQPQPPGFPLYVFLGRLLRMVMGDAKSALTLLSTLSGVTVALILYGLGNSTSKGRAPVGVGAALLMGLSPMGWLTAEKALSDTPGLALTLLALWLLWQGQEKLTWLALGSLVSGLSTGLRPQNGLPVLLLWVGLTVRHLVRRRSLTPLACSGLPFLLGTLVWLLPTAHMTGGLSPYLTCLVAHSAHVRQADSLWAMEVPLYVALRARVLAFADTFLTHTAGASLSDGWGWADTARGLGLTLVVGPGLIAANWRRRETWLCAGWLALAAGQVFLLEALDRPRLMLPLLAPLALLVAQGWAQLRRLRSLAAVPAVAAFALLLQGVPLAAGLASVPAPPTQAAAYVAAHYLPAETLVAAAGSFRAAQVEIPTYQLLYLYTFDTQAARTLVESREWRYIAIFDRDQWPEEAIAALTADGRYVPLEDRTFTRDPRLHTQHDQVRLQVLTPADQLPLEAIALPPGGCIDVGGPEDSRYLDRGWYRPEEIGGVAGRWAGGIPTTTLRLYIEPTAENVSLTLRALAYPAGQTVTVRVGGQTITRVALAPVWGEYTVSLPASAIPTDGPLLIELAHARLAIPFVVTEGASSDHRALAAAYDWICFAVDTLPPESTIGPATEGLP